MRAVARICWFVVPLGAAALAVIACTPAPRPPTPTRAVIPAVRVTPAPELDGQVIADSLLASGLPVGDVRVFDAQSDPDRLLGRANQYSAKVAWRDRRAEADASIEVFPTAASFQARKVLLEARNSRDGTVAEHLYDRAERRLLLRLPRSLTLAQVEEYDAWLGTL